MLQAFTMKQQASENNGLLSSEEVAAMAGMSRQALKGHIEAGRIQPCATIGRNHVFSRDAVRLWLQHRKKTGAKKRGPQPQNGGKK